MAFFEQVLGELFMCDFLTGLRKKKLKQLISNYLNFVKDRKTDFEFYEILRTLEKPEPAQSCHRDNPYRPFVYYFL
jgi:hypothetical protein